MRTPQDHPAYDRWLSAQSEALKAEKALYRAQLAEASGTGPPVPKELLAEARQLREEASKLLNLALGELARLAQPGPLRDVHPAPVSAARNRLPQSDSAGGADRPS